MKDNICQYDDALQRLSDLFQRLMQDVDPISDSVPAEQKHRRAFIRSVFALIEGVSFASKQVALEHAPDKFTDIERMLILEREANFSEQGVALERNMHLRTLPNVRFAFRCLCVSGSLEWMPDHSGPGWGAVVESIKIRNRLMHPKLAGDLEVSDRELLGSKRALKWFVANFFICLGRSVIAAKEEGARLMRQLEAHGLAHGGVEDEAQLRKMREIIAANEPDSH